MINMCNAEMLKCVIQTYKSRFFFKKRLSDMEFIMCYLLDVKLLLKALMHD